MAQQPVTAALIKELRDRTGVGMGKCKEALENAKGDIDVAIADLRKAGLASAVKKEGRATNEGMIGSAESSQAIGLVEVNSETDFVARNERFQQFVADVAQAVASSGSDDLDKLLQQQISKDDHQLTVDQYRASLVQTIGENIQVKRAKSFPKNANKSIGVYSHLNGKIVTVVEIGGGSGEEALAKDIAMHVAAASPEYLAPEDVPEATIANEREIAKSQVQGKPENIVDKIVDGKISAFYDSNCLARQKYIKNDELTIVELVEQRAKATGKPFEACRIYTLEYRPKLSIVKQPPPIWRRIQLTNFVSWEKLADFLQLSESQRQKIDCSPKFSLNLPVRLAEKIRKGDMNDPILKQFLPTTDEKAQTPNFVSDPTNDSACNLTPKLLQKYQGRVFVALQQRLRHALPLLLSPELRL